MRFLFNNIGNRHLKYAFQGKDKEGNAINENLYNEKYEFKTVSRKLLDNYEQEKEKISLEILGQYLEQNKNQFPDKIILFGTDQEQTHPTKTGQDTYWSAQIIKKIIEAQYNIPVEVYKIDQNPSDENKLFPLYQRILRQLYKELPEAKWFFLDAGGTPQQKLVCKLLMPEINENTQIEYLSNVEGVNEQDLIEKNTEELEKVFTKKSVKALIQKGHYASAYELLRKIDKRHPALPFVKIGKLRIENIQKDIAGEFAKNDKKNNPVVLQYLQAIPCIQLPELQENLSEKDYFLYGEFMARTHLYYQNKFNNQFILSFQQSCEVLALNFLWQYAQTIGKNIKKNKEGIEQLLKEEFNEERADLSIQYKAILQITDTENLNDVKQLFTFLTNINDSYYYYVLQNKHHIVGLDTLRNKVAHEAQPFEQIPRNIKKAFDELINLLELNKQTYQQLNQEITKRLF